MRRSSHRAATVENTSGFTLLELLIVLGVLSLVMAAVYTVYIGSTRIHYKATQLSGRQEQARTALNLMLREIRELGYDPSGAMTALGLTTPLLTADQNTLEFIGDVTRDGVTDKVKYAYDLTTKAVTRQFASWNSGSNNFGGYGAAAPVAGMVGGLTFTYYDNAGPPNVTVTGFPLSLANRLTVKRIVIQITMAADSSNPQQIVLSTGVRPRNL